MSIYIPLRQHEIVFFFNDTATTEIYTLSLHDALPIYLQFPAEPSHRPSHRLHHPPTGAGDGREAAADYRDRKSTRLNSSHDQISYAVFCLKKKTPTPTPPDPTVIKTA